jgi:hypothetical protein
MQQDLQKEQENLRKRQAEILNNLQKEFDSEKQLKKEKFSMQMSKFMNSGQSFDELDEGDEKREIAVIFIVFCLSAFFRNNKILILIKDLFGAY